ncbi:hypothetical protein [Streptomyces arboris]|uniref:hypothetical protein n=1 Tax=Streptomyces arboris TaxID=2600619 RepID=UPI003C2B0F18
MEDSGQLEAALEVAKNQLAAAESDLLEARRRVHQLRAAVYSLSELVAEHGQRAGQDSLFTADPAPGTRTEIRTGVSAELRGHTELDRADSSSTDRAVAILSDAGRPLRMKEIRAEWERRRWVDPKWRAPASAINMIYQRALKAGKVGRMADGSWVLPIAVQDEIARRRQEPGGWHSADA